MQNIFPISNGTKVNFDNKGHIYLFSYFFSFMHLFIIKSDKIVLIIF